MDMAAVSGAYTGLKFAKDVLQGVLAAKVAVDTHTQVSAALEKLGEAQDTLFLMREELFRFQHDNEELRRQLLARDDWNTQLIKYRLATTAGGATVYEHTGAPQHYACPSCMNDRKIQILQDRRVMDGIWDCPGCKAMYPIDPMKAAAARTARSPYLERRRRNEI
jgi:ribosomal protein L37AE/L43A